MSTNTLKRITGEAKRIRKLHPKKSWKAAVKEAGAKYRSGKLKTARKKTARKKSAVKVLRKVKRVVKSKTATLAPGASASSLLASARRILVSDIGKLEARKFTAKKKTDKRKISKLITAKKVQVRRLSK